jgi:RNA polymerase sigma-70 factor (ECF subfamily)
VSGSLDDEFAVRLAESSALAVRVAYSVLRNQSDAEDVAQEAFIRAHRRMAGLRDRNKFRSWLVRITWRLALDWRRSQRRRGAHEESAARLQPQVGNAEADLAAAEGFAHIWRAIDALPEKLRLVLVLTAIEGHSVRDVAELVGIPEGTVKSRLFDARKRLEDERP